MDLCFEEPYGVGYNSRTLLQRYEASLGLRTGTPEDVPGLSSSKRHFLRRCSGSLPLIVLHSVPSEMKKTKAVTEDGPTEATDR
jgi:hypothetical protein